MSKRIDEASLRAGGKELSRIGKEIGRSVNTLSSETTNKNSPWGGDDLGTIFGSLYNPLANKAFEFYREAGAAVDELGGWLTKRADDNNKTEEDNKKKVEDSGGG